MSRLDLFIQEISQEISDEENIKRGFQIKSQVRSQILRYFKDVNDIKVYESYIKNNVNQKASQFLLSWVKNKHQEAQKLKLKQNIFLNLQSLTKPNQIIIKINTLYQQFLNQKKIVSLQQIRAALKQKQEYFENLNQQQLREYVKLLVYSLMTTKLEEDKQIILKLFFKCLKPSFKLSTIIQCMNIDLKKINLGQHAQFLRKFFELTMNQCRKLYIWKPESIVTQIYWLGVFQSQSLLKQFLIDFTFQEISKLQQSNKEQSLVELASNLLSSKINIKDENKVLLFSQILRNQNINSMIKQKVINIILSNPIQIKSYLNTFKFSMQKIKNKTQKSLNLISSQIKTSKVSNNQLSCYKKMSEENNSTVLSLFYLIEFDFQNHIMKIAQQSQNYTQKLYKVAEIINHYQYKVQSLLRFKQQVKKSYDYHINSQFLSFHQDKQIETFFNFLKIPYSIIKYAIIFNIMDIDSESSVDNFINRSRLTTDEATLGIKKLIQNHRQNQLDLNELIPIITFFSEKEIKQLFSIDQNILQQQINDIIKIKNINNKQNKILHEVQAMLFFEKILRFLNIGEKAKLYQYLEILQSPNFKSKVFLEIIKQMQKIKNLFKIKQQVEDIFIQCAGLEEIYGNLLQLKKNQIQDLESYITYKEQSQIDLKQVSQLKFIHNFVHQVIYKSKYLQQLVANLAKLSQNSKNYIQFFSSSLKTCKSSFSGIVQSLKQSQNHQSLLKDSLKEIMNKSSVIGNFRYENQQRQIYIQTQKRPYSHELVSQWRDRLIVIINNIKKSQKSQKQTLTLQKFLIFYESFNDLVNNYKKLDNTGYLKQFVEEEDVLKLELKIREGNFNQIQKHSKMVQKQFNSWKQNSKKAFQQSFVLCHFEGKQLQYLSQKIFVDRQYFFSLQRILKQSTGQIITENNFFEILKNQQKIIKQANQELNISNKLQIMKNAFCNLAKQHTKVVNMYSKKDKNKQKIIVKCLIVDQDNFYKGITMHATNYNAIKNLNLPQILLCSQTTRYQQIQKFLFRAVHDLARSYYVVGICRLPANIQNDFCTILQSLYQNQTFKKQIKEINLCFINNSFIQKIFNFMINCRFISLVKVQNQLQKIQSDYFKRKAGNLTIVHSKSAGLGKTFYITQMLKNKNLNIKYFPVSGELQQTRLLSRLKQLKIDDKSALVIQIHNVKNQKVLDWFLFQVIFYKGLKVQQFFYLPQNLTIAIQLQNVDNQNHFDKYESLRLLQEQKNIVIYLTDIEQENIVIDVQDSKLMFVMIYLQWLSDKSINEQQVSYQDFKKDYRNNEKYFLTEQKCQKLIGKYFLQYFKNKNTKPSYIQLHSFIKNLFQSLVVFANSPFFLKLSIDFTMGPLDVTDFRQKFMQVLLNNSLNFLKRTLLIQNNQIKFFQQIRNFQFFILPNADLTTYSFIYKDHKHVDIVIKQYILIQNRVINDIQQFVDDQFIQEQFQKYSYNSLSPIALKNKLFQSLKNITNQNQEIPQNSAYSLTLDNFFKMCLVVQRMRSQIPVIIMGQTGVGKTALLKFLIQQAFKQKLFVVNIHCGIDETAMIQIVESMKKQAEQMKKQKQEMKAQGKDVKQTKLWVFFDEFNTTQQLGYIKQIVMDRKFLGEPLGDQFVFICACNPKRKILSNKDQFREGIQKKKQKNDLSQLIYKVFSPPESMIQSMWNYEQLKKQEGKVYIQTILRDLKYKPDLVANIVAFTHQYFVKSQDVSRINLRDVARFKILFDWFLKALPYKKFKEAKKKSDENFNYTISRQERAFVMSLSLCYHLRLQKFQNRDKYLSLVQNQLQKPPGYLKRIIQNQQNDFMDRIDKPTAIAVNQALRQNMYTSFVCIVNKLPMIIVGRPGSSKSLAIKLLISNLKGIHSQNQYFRQFPEFRIFYFQGSQSCTSQGIQRIFKIALSKTEKDKIPLILFDQIGLAELSEHRPLKILHSYLQLTQERKVAFIGLSNRKLDASKMSRSLIVKRPSPDKQSLSQTALKIFRDQISNNHQRYQQYIKGLSDAYFNFIQKWREEKYNNYKGFYGLRDFYSLINQCCLGFSKQTNANYINDEFIQNTIVKSVSKSFDGRNNSIELFLKCFKLQNKKFNLNFKTFDIIQLIKQNLENKKNSRCLLLIIKGQSLVHYLNQTPQILAKNKLINIHGSTFLQDIDSQTYIIQMVVEIIDYVSQGYVIVLKDIPNSVLTSFYDLLNKNFHIIGGKSYCRIGVGSYYNPRCFVHNDFNCVVYIMEDKLHQVDPPFLNRFQKHYLIFDQFLGEKEVHVFQKIKEWETIIFKQVLQANSKYLPKEHFLINSCNQSLVSLIIKLIREKSQLSSEQVIKTIKQMLLFNATTDFQLYLQMIKDKIPHDEFNFICDTLNKKQQFIKNSLNQENKLLVFTYNQNISINNKNILGFQSKKTIKIVQIKCEKQLKSQIQDFYSEDEYKTCQIIIEYQKQHQHLCLILFLLQSYSQKLIKEKRVCIVVVLSRITLISLSKKYEQISHLNGFRQIFIESLSPTFQKITELPDNGQQLQRQFELLEIIPTLMTKAIKRLNFEYSTQQQNEKNLSIFINLLRNLQKNNLFLTLSQNYFMNRWKKGQNDVNLKNWKHKLLQKGQICKMAQTTTQAMNIYFNNIFEDWLSSFISWLIENEVIYCFDENCSVKILQNYIPGIQLYLKKDLKIANMKSKSHQLIYQDNLKLKYCQLLENRIRSYIEQDQIINTRVSREPGSEKCFLKFPKLFPFSHKEIIYIFKEEIKFEQQQFNSQYSTLDKICDQIKEQQSQYFQMKKNKQVHVDFLKLIQKAKQLIKNQTQLKIRDKNKDIILNYLQKLNNVQQTSVYPLRNLLLIDLRNIFLYNLTTNQLSRSVWFNQTLDIFKKDVTTLQTQILILMIGSQLWIKLIQINRILDKVGQFQIFQQFILNYRVRETQILLRSKQQGNIIQFFNQKSKFVGKLIKCLSEKINLTNKNIQINGFQNYSILFDNVFNILQNLQYEFSYYQHQGNSITISSDLRIIKNFKKLLENITNNQPQQLIKEFLINQNAYQNIYSSIQKFLLELRSNSKYDKKHFLIFQFQANTLHQIMLKEIIDKKQAEQPSKKFIQNFLSLVNQNQSYAHSCTNILIMIFKDVLNKKDEQNNNSIKATDAIQNLSIKNLDILQKQISDSIIQSSLSNNLTIIVVDLFCKYLIKDVPIEQSEQQQTKILKPIEMYTDEFKKLMKINIKQFNGIQIAIFLAFCKTFLTQYIKCLEGLQMGLVCDQMIEIDTILQYNSFFSDNLKIFCLNLIKQTKKSSQQFKKQYILSKKATWIQQFENKPQFFQEQLLKISKIVNQKTQIDQFIVQIALKNRINVQILQKMIQLKDYVSRYKLFHYFLEQIYCSKKEIQNKDQILYFLAKTDKLSRFQIKILQGYLNKKITKNIINNNITQIQTINDHILKMNSINWLLSIKYSKSPLTSVFFKDSKLPESFSEHISHQLLPLGQLSIMQQKIQNVKRFFPSRSTIYACSPQCSFLCIKDSFLQEQQCAKCKQFGSSKFQIIGPQWLKQKQQTERTDISILGNLSAHSRNTISQNIRNLHGLQSLQIYRKIISSYIQLQINRISQNQQQKLGFQTVQLTNIQRIHQITQIIIKLIFDSIYYIWIELEFISNQQCEKAFGGKNSQQMSKQFLKSFESNSKKLQQKLNFSQWKLWLIGIQKQIFNFIQNFEQNIRKYQTNKIKQFLNQVQIFTLNQQNENFKQFFISVLKQEKIFKNQDFSNSFFRRDFFQQSIQKIIKQNLGQNRRNYKKSLVNQQIKPQLQFLQKSSSHDADDYNYQVALKYSYHPSISHLQDFYGIKIRDEYPILHLIMTNMQKIQTLNMFSQVILFLNKIFELANYRILKSESKKTKIEQFCISYKIQLQQLSCFQLSFNKILKNLSVKQQLLKLKNYKEVQYSQQTYLFKFLLFQSQIQNDKQREQQQYWGRIISKIYYVFAIKVNELINMIQISKNNCPSLKSLELFSYSPHHAQKIKQKDLPLFDQEVLKYYVNQYSSCSISDRIPNYDFEAIQNKIVLYFYGKKRLIKNQSQFISINFIGQNLKRTKNGQYLQSIRKLGANVMLSQEQQKRVKEQFEKIKDKQFYCKMKQFQGFLQQIMQLYKIFKPTNTQIGKFIEHYQIKRVPEQLIKYSNFKQLSIQCLVSLYEAGQQAINTQNIRQLDQKYSKEINQFQTVSSIKEFLEQMKKNEDRQNLPTLQQFKNALNRFVSRCLLYRQIDENKKLSECLQNRKDIWPFNYDKLKLQGLSRLNLRLSQVGSLYKIIKSSNQEKKINILVEKKKAINNKPR